jgi:hypothetical protein
MIVTHLMTTLSLKKFSTDKTLGYTLLAVGILMILIPVILVILVFTGKMQPAIVLNAPAPTMRIPTVKSTIQIPGLLEKLGFGVGQKDSPAYITQEIIPQQVFSFYVNAGIFYLLMLFIASAGSKTAGIGTKLIKDVTFSKS